MPSQPWDGIDGTERVISFAGVSMALLMTDAGLQTVCLMKGVLRLSVRLSGVGAQAVTSSNTVVALQATSRGPMPVQAVKKEICILQLILQNARNCVSIACKLAHTMNFDALEASTERTTLLGCGGARISTALLHSDG